MSKITSNQITVKNVRVGEAVQSVRFACKARGVFSARTRNQTPIRVRFNEDSGKFVAGNRTGKVTAKTADKAFALAAKEIWAN